MKLGDVLKKEREKRGLSAETVAQQMNITVDVYHAIEAGEDAPFESAATLVLSFNEMIQGQVGQLYYPCGLPFTEVANYDVKTG
ncbi:MAG: helix-turn-helix transcriptional regulator [bacterium]|nr:helix-turn-helix transcriptional regulator [bacterium]